MKESNQKELDYCHLTEQQIETLISSIFNPNENSKKIIQDAYTQRKLAPENNLVSMMWDARHSVPGGYNKDYYKRNTKKLNLIKEHAEELINIFQFNGDYIVENFDNLALKDLTYSYTTDDGIDTFAGQYKTCDEICDVMAQLIEGVEHLKKIRVKGRANGRPSLFSYYEFMLMNAKLYEQVSGNNFKVLRHKNEDFYEPITEGHLFLDRVNKILNHNRKYKYSSANLINACEKAVKRLKLSR